MTAVIIPFICRVPLEKEVANAKSGNHSNAQVEVKGHEDQHQKITYDQVDNIEERLQEVKTLAHHRPEMYKSQTRLVWFTVRQIP